MSDQCIAAQDLGDLVAGSAKDPRWAHVAECPRCRTLVASYRKFLAGSPELADGDADAELERRLAAEIVPSKVRVDKSGARWSRSVFSVSLGLAAVLATVLIFSGRPNGVDRGPIVIRGSESPADERLTVHPPRVTGGNELLLAWAPVPGARSYVVRLVAGDLAEVQRWTVAADTVLTISRPLPVDLGTDFYWQVEALDEGGVIAGSALTLAPPLR